MSEVRLTYIVPVCNTRDYVLRCLQSLVSQDIPEPEYEIVVVDDGSTDGSRDIIDAFAREHPRVVKVLSQANAGVSAARNRAIEEARGDYVQFVDSDDYLASGMMVHLLRRATELDLDALVFNYQPIDADGHPVQRDRNDNFASAGPMTGVEYLDTHVMTPYIWRFLIRREYLNQETLRFNSSLIVCEDGELIARLLLGATRVAHDELTPYCYVHRGNSAMHSQDKEHLRRRLFSQVDSALSITNSINQYEAKSGRKAPASVSGLKNVYLFFSMTKALTSGLVDDVLQRIKQYGLYPFPCIGPEAGYEGRKWGFIHTLMMCPSLWRFLSWVYRLIK